MQFEKEEEELELFNAFWVKIPQKLNYELGKLDTKMFFDSNTFLLVRCSYVVEAWIIFISYTIF